MQCVILAAGRGTRMLRLTKEVPKPLLQYKEKPILEWNLENLPREIDEVIFVIGYLEGQIREFIKNLPRLNPPPQRGGGQAGVKITFVMQTELDGTGGALTLCKDKLHNKFLVLNSDDIYTAGDLSRLIAHKLAILGFWSHDWTGSSLLVDEEQHMVGIESNPPREEEKIANTGAYMLDKRFFDYPMATIKNGKEFSIPHTLVTISQDHQIFVERATFWKQINKPDDLKLET